MRELGIKIFCFIGKHEYDEWIHEVDRPKWRSFMRWRANCKHCNKQKIVEDHYDRKKINEEGKLVDRYRNR